MLKPLFLPLLWFGLSFSGSFYDCVLNAIDMERAISIAREHTGKPYKAWISKSKRTGECFWKVRGTEGYVILEATSGELVRFYRNRDRR